MFDVSFFFNIIFFFVLEKTEGATRNGQSRETGNIWVHKTQNEEKQNKKHNTENKKNKKNLAARTHQKKGVNTCDRQE